MSPFYFLTLRVFPTTNSTLRKITNSNAEGNSLKTSSKISPQTKHTQNSFPRA